MRALRACAPFASPAHAPVHCCVERLPQSVRLLPQRPCVRPSCDGTRDPPVQLAPACGTHTPAVPPVVPPAHCSGIREQALKLPACLHSWAVPTCRTACDPAVLAALRWRPLCLPLTPSQPRHPPLGRPVPACTRPRAQGSKCCLVQDLRAHMSTEAEACLSLGLPATVSHVIDDHSPLANISIQTMAARHMEVRTPPPLAACLPGVLPSWPTPLRSACPPAPPRGTQPMSTHAVAASPSYAAQLTLLVSLLRLCTRISWPTPDRLRRAGPPVARGHMSTLLQIVALLSATDAMTSHTIEARHSYLAEDIVLNGQPHGVRRRDDGRLVVDYTCFRKRASGDLTLDDARLNFETQSPIFLDSPGVAHGVAVQQAEADSRSMRLPDEGALPDDDAVPEHGSRSPRSSLDAPRSSQMGPSPRQPRRSESGHSRELGRSRGSSQRRWDTELALDLDHTALPRVVVSADAPDRRRSIAGAPRICRAAGQAHRPLHMPRLLMECDTGGQVVGPRATVPQQMVAAMRCGPRGTGAVRHAS